MKLYVNEYYLILIMIINYRIGLMTMLLGYYDYIRKYINSKTYVNLNLK